MRKVFHYIIFSGLIGVPIVLLILPADFFNTGPEICVSQLIFDVSCPGCGMTRASMHLIHLQFAQAWSFNKLVFIVFPILAYLWLIEVRKYIRLLKRKDRMENQ